MIRQKDTTWVKHMVGKVRDSEFVDVVGGFIKDLHFGIFFNIALVLAVTHLCMVYNVRLSGTASGIIATVVIFPLAFSINAAYMRRQNALQHFASLKGSLWVIHGYHKHLCEELSAVEEYSRTHDSSDAMPPIDPTPPPIPLWPSNNVDALLRPESQQSWFSNVLDPVLPPEDPIADVESTIDSNDLADVTADANRYFNQQTLSSVSPDVVDIYTQHMQALFDAIAALLVNIRDYCTQERHHKRSTSLEQVYASFRQIHAFNNRVVSLSRANDVNLNDVNIVGALGKAIDAFEQIRITRDYATPKSARQYFKVVGQSFPLLVAPNFVFITDESGNWGAYYLAVIVSLAFSLLVTIQDKLNNPFNTVTKSKDGFVTYGTKHPDNIDLTKLVFWPAVAIQGNVGQTAVQCTLGGGPTDKSKALFRRLIKMTRADRGTKLPGKNDLYISRRGVASRAPTSFDVLRRSNDNITQTPRRSVSADDGKSKTQHTPSPQLSQRKTPSPQPSHRSSPSSNLNHNHNRNRNRNRNRVHETSPAAFAELFSPQTSHIAIDMNDGDTTPTTNVRHVGNNNQSRLDSVNPNYNPHSTHTDTHYKEVNFNLNTDASINTDSTNTNNANMRTNPPPPTTTTTTSNNTDVCIDVDTNSNTNTNTNVNTNTNTCDDTDSITTNVVYFEDNTSMTSNNSAIQTHAQRSDINQVPSNNSNAKQHSHHNHHHHQQQQQQQKQQHIQQQQHHHHQQQHQQQQQSPPPPPLTTTPPSMYQHHQQQLPLLPTPHTPQPHPPQQHPPHQHPPQPQPLPQPQPQPHDYQPQPHDDHQLTLHNLQMAGSATRIDSQTLKPGKLPGTRFVISCRPNETLDNAPTTPTIHKSDNTPTTNSSTPTINNSNYDNSITAKKNNSNNNDNSTNNNGSNNGNNDNDSNNNHNSSSNNSNNNNNYNPISSNNDTVSTTTTPSNYNFTVQNQPYTHETPARSHVTHDAVTHL